MEKAEGTTRTIDATPHPNFYNQALAWAGVEARVADANKDGITFEGDPSAEDLVSDLFEAVVLTWVRSGMPHESAKDKQEREYRARMGEDA